MKSQLLLKAAIENGSGKFFISYPLPALNGSVKDCCGNQDSSGLRSPAGRAMGALMGKGWFK
jgi:hypothetical protein